MAGVFSTPTCPPPRIAPYTSRITSACKTQEMQSFSPEALWKRSPSRRRYPFARSHIQQLLLVLVDVMSFLIPLL